MKLSVWVIVLMTCIVFLISVSASGQSLADEQLKQFYQDCIMNNIAKCQSKTVLHTSKSGNLKSCAALYVKKASFLTSYKDILISEMMEHRIDAKPYKVDYYLNKRFFEMTQ